MLTGYLGLVLLGALFLSVGVLASALTENQIVAAFVSIGLLLVLWLLAGLGSLLGDTAIGQAVSYLSFMEHYDHLAWVVRRRHSDFFQRSDLMLFCLIELWIGTWK